MIKVRSSRFQQCLCPFTMLFVEEHSELDFSDIYLIAYCGDGNFGKTSTMRVIFSFENAQNFMQISKMRRKIQKKSFFSFWENSIWIGCVKLSLLRCEYLSSAVNVLTNSFKIFHRTNLDFFQLNYFQSDQ